MSFRFEARESVGYRLVWTITRDGAPVDITSWTFKASFQRQAGTPDFTLSMAADGGETSQGFFIIDGPGGLLSINILPATLQGIADSTGRFTLNADLLGDPPGDVRQFIDDIIATIIQGPTT